MTRIHDHDEETIALRELVGPLPGTTTVIRDHDGDRAPSVQPSPVDAPSDGHPDREAALADLLRVRPTHRLDGIELQSLAIFASLFYGAAFLAFALGVSVAWLFASTVGIVGRFEEFMQSIGFSDFQVVGPELIVGSLLLGIAFVVSLTVITVFAGAFYNVMARSGRTVQVRIKPVDA